MFLHVLINNIYITTNKKMVQKKSKISQKKSSHTSWFSVWIFFDEDEKKKGKFVKTLVHNFSRDLLQYKRGNKLLHFLPIFNSILFLYPALVVISSLCLLLPFKCYFVFFYCYFEISTFSDFHFFIFFSSWKKIVAKK